MEKQDPIGDLSRQQLKRNLVGHSRSGASRSLAVDPSNGRTCSLKRQLLLSEKAKACMHRMGALTKFDVSLLKARIRELCPDDYFTKLLWWHAFLLSNPSSKSLMSMYSPSGGQSKRNGLTWCASGHIVLQLYNCNDNAMQCCQTSCRTHERFWPAAGRLLLI